MGAAGIAICVKNKTGWALDPACFIETRSVRAGEDSNYFLPALAFGDLVFFAGLALADFAGFLAAFFVAMAELLWD